jgi:hypothetical protein
MGFWFLWLFFTLGSLLIAPLFFRDELSGVVLLAILVISVMLAAERILL